MDSGFAQHFIECTTCDSNAQFHCNTCQFNLCQDCRDRHQQRKETSNHDVVPYIQRKERAACERCKFHPDKIYEACCKPCEMPVCMKCVQEVHNGHKLTNIEGVFKAKMNELMFLVRHLRDESLTESTTLATQIEQNKKKCKREIAKIRSDLRSTAQEIKNLVDVILQEKNQNLTDIEASLMLELQSQEKKMQNFISEIKIFLKEHEAKGPISSSVEFILTHNERVDAIKRMTDVPELPEVSPPRHQQKTLERNDVEKLFGNITEQSLKFNIKRHTGTKQKNLTGYRESGPSAANVRQERTGQLRIMDNIGNGLYKRKETPYRPFSSGQDRRMDSVSYGQFGRNEETYRSISSMQTQRMDNVGYGQFGRKEAYFPRQYGGMFDVNFTPGAYGRQERYYDYPRENSPRRFTKEDYVKGGRPF